MIKIVIKPSSRKQNNEWIPEGMIIFPSGETQTERSESYSKKFETKWQADQYFSQMSHKKYKIGI